MTPKLLAAAAALLALGACSTMISGGGNGASNQPFDPAACYTREYSVYFDGDSSALTRDGRAVIDATGAAVRGCRIQHVRIIGSAEATGPEDINEQISIERARNIADYMVRTLAWPRESLQLMATGERGAVTPEGLNRPMRRSARVTVEAVAP